jgi:hypothetical protein
MTGLAVVVRVANFGDSVGGAASRAFFCDGDICVIFLSRRLFRDCTFQVFVSSGGKSTCYRRLLLF